MNLIGVGGVDPRNGQPYTYIETIAEVRGVWSDGTDGAGNMTNTMNTPVEALEITTHYDECYEFRKGTGGAGKSGVGSHCLGTFHRSRSKGFAFAERRDLPPYGCMGRSWRGRAHFLVGMENTVKELPGKTTFSLPPITLIIQTPGGGGWESGERPDAVIEDRLDEKM